jgi:hypothetical protein
MVVFPRNAWGTRVVVGPGARALLGTAREAADPKAALDSIRKLLGADAERFKPAHGRESSARDVHSMLDRL